MKRLFISLLTLTTLCVAEPLKMESLTIGYNTYKKVKLEKITNDEVRITHDSGLRRVNKSLLPADIVKKLSMTPISEDEQLRKQAEQEEARQRLTLQQERQRSIDLRSKVYDETFGGKVLIGEITSGDYWHRTYKLTNGDYYWEDSTGSTGFMRFNR